MRPETHAQTSGQDLSLKIDDTLVRGLAACLLDVPVHHTQIT